MSFKTENYVFSEGEDRTHCSEDCGLGGSSSPPSSWKKHLPQDISGNVKVSNRSFLHDSLGLRIFSFTDRHQTTPHLLYKSQMASVQPK